MWDTPIGSNNSHKKFCQYCGTKLDVGARFCKSCGKPIDQGVHSAAGCVSPQADETFSHKQYTERKTVYEGQLHKCPNCGELLDAFRSHCPSCGYEIRDARSSSSVRELAQKLERIEAERMAPIEEKKSLMKMVLGKDLKGEDEEEKAQEKFDEQKKQQKANLIINFSVPNTREDILEFMILASSNIDVKKGINDEVSKAWLQKLEQVYQRAQITIRNTNEFKQVKFIYDSKQKELGNQKKRKKNKIIGGVILMGAGLLLYMLGMMLGESTGDSDSSLYSICTVGIFVMLGGIFLLLATIPNGN